METFKFPDGFKWGSATSAHQVEGRNHNDWTVWEKSEVRVKSLKLKDLNPADFISGRACDSYNRYEEDFDNAQKLNQNIHRFSIEWSRIEPEEGKFNEKEIEHYKRLIDALRERGIEPMVTLWHFTNPIWFAEKGGWLNRKAPGYFTRYAKYVADNLKDEVGLWITFNESTTIYSTFAYLRGMWPPHKTNLLSFLRATRNFKKAHILAYREIKKIYNVSSNSDRSSLASHNSILQRTSTSQNGTTLCDISLMSHNVVVGITENNVYVPDTKNFWRTLVRRIYRRFRNFYFFDNNTPYYDFIGLNYYHISREPNFGEKYELVPKQEFMKEMNWEIYPEGIYHVLRDLSKFKKPIYITENGIADGTDQLREKFIKEHLRWIWQAIQDGVDVRGYMYWSLLDNFEWAEGFAPRFGLVEIDPTRSRARDKVASLEDRGAATSNGAGYATPHLLTRTEDGRHATAGQKVRGATLERKIRPSAYEYARICETNSMIYDL